MKFAFDQLLLTGTGTGKDFQITAKSPLLTFVTVSVLTHWPQETSYIALNTLIAKAQKPQF